MTKKIQKERRSAPRAKRVMSVSFRKIEGKKKGSWLLSTTENLSSAGVAFLTEKELRVGDILELEIRMSGMLDMFSGLTEVVRVLKKDSGRHFLVAVKRYNPDKKSSKK